MDKKMYNRPEMKIVLLRHRAFLLSSPESDPSTGGGSEVPGSTTGGARRIRWDEE